MSGETAAILFMCVWCLLIGLFAVFLVRQAVRNVKRFHRHTRPARLTVPVAVDALKGRRVAFRAESGDGFSLTLPEREALSLAPGMQGLLTFRGRKFISFTPGKGGRAPC